MGCGRVASIIRVGWLGVAAGLSGCGGGPSGVDAGALDGGSDALAVALPPEIPWLLPDGTVELPARLVPCPDGWREVLSESGVASCEPYPAAGPATCAAGEAHFAGEAGCAPVGSPCPAGDFADGLPDDGTVLFVLAGAPPGGDGTRALPFQRIGEALGRASAGMTVGVGRGRYDEVLTLRAGVTIAGACAAATIIAYAGSDPRPALVNAAVSDATVRDATLGPADRVGVSALGSSTALRLEGVVIDHATGHGVLAGDGARITAGGLVVRETQPDARGALGRGLGVQGGAGVEVSRALLERNRELGAFAYGAGTTLVLADAVVRDTQSRASDRGGGPGLSVQEGARAEVSRALLASNRDIGINASGTGAALVLTDVIVRDTGSEETDRSGGRGLNVQFGASAEVSRALFERNRDVGIFAGAAGTVVTLTDVVVRDTQPQESDGDGGRGLNVQDGAAATVSRALFEGNHEIAIQASDGGAMLVVTDIVVRDTRSRQRDLRGGRGLGVELGTVAVVSRALFERNGEIGVFASGAGTMITLSDVVVRDTRSQESDQVRGRGLNVEFGAAAEVSRAVFERNREMGVLAYEAGTGVQLTDVAVRDTRASDLGLGGVAAGSYLQASVELRRFVLTGSALAGVQLARDGTVDLHEGEVSRNLIGANVQTSGFDVGRLSDRVVYRDNVRDLAQDELPVPEPALPPGGP